MNGKRSGLKVSKQVSVYQIRQIHEMIDPIIPLMNIDEMGTLALVVQSFLDRYKHEKYPNYDWSKDGEDQ